MPGVAYNVDRIWLAQKNLTPSRHQEPRQRQYPLLLRPDEKVSVEDVMRVLRATYEGTVLEGKATRPIGYDKTAESHIVALNSAMPLELRGLIWQAVSTPLGAPYVPLYRVMDRIPPAYSLGNNRYGPSSAYWSFRGLFALSGIEGASYKKRTQQMWDEFERQSLDQLEHLSAPLAEIYQRDRETACDLARRYSEGLAYQAVDLANSERDALMTHIAKRDSDSHRELMGSVT